MTRLVTCFALALGLAAGCGPLYGGSCPDSDELPRHAVLSGDYDNPEVYDYGDSEPFREASQTRLVVDRDGGNATLTFTTADGREVEINYVATAAEWSF